ncbi:hypothetical protein SATRM34S_06792 [Streptomyces atroolivaceus]
MLHGCRQTGFPSRTRYVTAGVAAQLTLARAGLATALVLRTAIDPATPGIGRVASRVSRPPRPGRREAGGSGARTA